MKTISACLIIKNEVENITALISDLAQFCEEIIMVDTGSTDGTYELLTNLTRTYPQLRVAEFEWIKDFSAARNYAFSLATQDAIFWCDADDRIPQFAIDGFNQIKTWLGDNHVINMAYHYGGEVYTYNHRLIDRNCLPRWESRIHEYLVFDGMVESVSIPSDQLVVTHHRKSVENSRNRNIDIYFEMIKDLNYEFTSRDWAYYGMEVYNQSMCEEGVQIWLPHLHEMSTTEVSYVFQNMYTYLRDYDQLERFYHIMVDYQNKGFKLRNDILAIMGYTCLALNKVQEGIQYCRYAFGEDRYNEEVDQYDYSDWYLNCLGNYAYSLLLSKVPNEMDKALYRMELVKTLYPDYIVSNDQE